MESEWYRYRGLHDPEGNLVYLTEPLLDRRVPPVPAPGDRGVSPAIVDCDVHNVVGPIETLEPYLDAHWREVIATSQFAGPTDQAHPPNLATSLRADLAPVDGAAPGRTVASMRAQLLDPLGTELAILSCDYGVESVRNPDAAAALARGGQRVAGRRVARPRAAAAGGGCRPLAAARGGGDARSSTGPQTGALSRSTCRCARPSRTATGSGGRCGRRSSATSSWPSCTSAGSAGVPPTAAGWPTTWLEEYVDMASAFAAQLTSLVAEGAFDRFSGLRVSLIESGFAWLPAFLWRFDKGWRGLRREVPWTTRLPSEYVRDHVRVSLQPVDGPPEAAELLRVHRPARL